MSLATAECPACRRQIRVQDGRFNDHSTIPKHQSMCWMSQQHIPVEGLRPVHFVTRARVVADLAYQVQDADPAVVSKYLDALPADEVKRLMVIALAAINTDQTVEDMFGWVCDLPASQVPA